MILKHLVDKHNLYFVYGPSNISQRIHATAINIVIVSIVMLQLSFLALAVLRKGLTDITIYSITGFVITILFFIAHWLFHCCRGFSPIAYQVSQKIYLFLTVVFNVRSAMSWTESKYSLLGLQPNSPSQSSTPSREPARNHHFVPHVLQPEASPNASGSSRSMRNTINAQVQPELVTVHNLAEDLSRIQQAYADEMGDREEIIQVHVPGSNTSHGDKVILDQDGTCTDV